MNIVLILSALIIGALVVGWVFKVFTLTLKTGAIIIALLIILHLTLGISPGQIGQQLQQFIPGQSPPAR